MPKEKIDMNEIPKFSDFILKQESRKNTIKSQKARRQNKYLFMIECGADESLIKEKIKQQFKNLTTRRLEINALYSAVQKFRDCKNETAR